MLKESKDKATGKSLSGAKPKDVPVEPDSQNTASDVMVSYKHLKWIQI